MTCQYRAIQRMSSGHALAFAAAKFSSCGIIIIVIVIFDLEKSLPHSQSCQCATQGILIVASRSRYSTCGGLRHPRQTCCKVRGPPPPSLLLARAKRCSGRARPNQQGGRPKQALAPSQVAPPKFTPGRSTTFHPYPAQPVICFCPVSLSPRLTSTTRVQFLSLRASPPPVVLSASSCAFPSVLLAIACALLTTPVSSP